MNSDTRRSAGTFVYDDVRLDAATNTVSCHYRLDEWQFTETVTLPAGGDWTAPAVAEAARLLFLLAGVSYYKAGAPPVIDLGGNAVTDSERDFLRQYYIDGLGEFAYRATPRLDLTGLEIRGPRLERPAPVGFSSGFTARPSTPLIPFGGGIDSIVSVEMMKPGTVSSAVSPSLFVVNRPNDRFEAIEKPAAVTGLPIVRAERVLDPQILRSAELGFLNGHVPVTGVISAIAVLAATVGGHDAVVMSNEWSASVGTVEFDGRSINHQYSKSMAFETGLRQWISEAIGPGLEYFSLLRPFTELWIARRFAELTQYFDTFRSCNRAFHVDRTKRLDHWCARCDKCCFIDLILAPFVDAKTLRDVFAAGGPEPLRNPELYRTFETLLGLIPDSKPWECVGDVHESQVAVQLAAARADRQRDDIVRDLARRVHGGEASALAKVLLKPVGRHHIPTRYLPAELAVAATGPAEQGR